MSECIGIIGGTGFYSADFLNDASEYVVTNRYGDVLLTEGQVGSVRVAFLSRHGSSHALPPHKVNYRANILALKEFGVSQIIATNAVGGIANDTPPRAIILPDQIIDYTYGREHTFFDSFENGMSHIDFSHPFDLKLHRQLKNHFDAMDHKVLGNGCYGCTQGPRLETAAEIARMQRDGCTIVGMTGMPEAALAKELEMAYVSVCFVVNWAAGLADDISIDEIKDHAGHAIKTVRSAIASFLVQAG